MSGPYYVLWNFDCVDISCQWDTYEWPAFSVCLMFETKSHNSIDMEICIFIISPDRYDFDEITSTYVPHISMPDKISNHFDSDHRIVFISFSSN